MGAMMAGAGGSRAWSALCSVVLDRDRYTCQMTRDGHRCGAVATTVNHIVPRVYGGSDTLDNLEAACGPCNFRAGGRLRESAGQLVGHERVTGLVTLLDRVGVPYDAGRRTALAAAIKHSGHGWRQRDIDTATAYRRARGPLTRI